MSIFKRRAKIKIVHIVEGFLGGLSTYMCNVLPELAKCGCEVHLICSVDRCCEDAPAKLLKLRQAGVIVYLVPMKRSINPLADICSFFQIVRIMRRQRFDIVHTHCSKAGALGRIASLLAGIKVRFHSSHCFSFLRCDFKIAAELYRLVEKVLSTITTQYIAVSMADAQSAQFAKLYAAHKCAVINNGLAPMKKDSSAFRLAETRAKFNVLADSHLIVTGCRLVEYKGLFIFLEAARLSVNDCVFLVAGDGKLKPEVQRYIANHGLEQKVRLLGYVPDMNQLYAICDVALLCSDREAQPYFLLEAMRAKCPIVASDVPGTRELLGEERGILVEQDAKKIATVIDNLVLNAVKKNQLRKNAYDHFSRDHILADQVRKLYELYDSGTAKNERMRKLANCIAASTAG